MTFEKLIEIMNKLFFGSMIDLSSVTKESRLVSDIGMNSVYLLMTAIAIEEEFGVELSEDLINSSTTVQDVIDFIENNK